MVELPALDIPSVLAELGLERVDWLKGDSQGTDLRLFRSLGDLASSVLVAEFEPGIIDAYEGEDKFADVLNDLVPAGSGCPISESVARPASAVSWPGASSAGA